MGKKGSWFSVVKKALTPEPKEKKEKKPQKPKRRWFGKQKSVDEETLVAENAKTSIADSGLSLPKPPPRLKVVKFTEPVEDEQSKLANTVASATAMAAEAAVAAATEVFRFLHVARFPGKSTEEIAAIKIQAAVRGYLERRSSRAWRGLVRLRLLIRGKSVQCQANTTLRCMQTLARVQYQIRARKIRLSEENQTLQKQLQQRRDKDEIQQKRDKDIEKQPPVSMGDNWESSAKSKEKVEANMQYRQEAAIRRERALAYAYTQQQAWKNNPLKTTNQSSPERTTQSWGWSWLERWMSTRTWEPKPVLEKDTNTEYCPSVFSTPSRAASVGELSRANSSHNLDLEIKAVVAVAATPNTTIPSTTTPNTTIPNTTTPNTTIPNTTTPNTTIPNTTTPNSTIPNTSTPNTTSTSSTRTRTAARQYLSFPRTKERNRRSNSLGGDNDPRNPLKEKPERNRRSNCGDSIASDDEGPASASVPSTPMHKANTKLTKSRTGRMPSPLRNRINGSVVTPEKPPGLLKKRPSLTGSPSGRTRQSLSVSPTRAPKNIRVDA